MRALAIVSAQPLGRSRPRDAYSPFIARQLRGAARTDIALIRARFENPVNVDASTAKEWAAVDNLKKARGPFLISIRQSGHSIELAISAESQREL